MFRITESPRHGCGVYDVRRLKLAGLLASMALTGAVVSEVRADVTLVQNGQAKAAIYASPEQVAADKSVVSNSVLPEYQAEMARRKVRDSINDLALYLEKISGAKIEVVPGEPAATDKRIPIYVGDVAARKFGPVGKSTTFKQAFRIVIGPKGIGLLGESDESTSYAIYEILDRLGVRWVIPSDMGELVPSMKTVKLVEGDAVGGPTSDSRFIWYADEAFKRRTRQGGMSIAAGHALEVHSGDRYGYLTKQQLEAHPDWNAEMDGKRTVNGRFCWGNPEVAVAVADSINNILDKSYSPSVSLSPEDGAVFCECAKCKALDAGDWDPTMNQVSSTDRYVNFCNRIAERVAQKHPNVLLGFLAYVQYTRPPVREKLHPNLVPEIAPITYCRAHAFTDASCPSRSMIRDIVRGWGKASKQVAYYNYMFHLAEVAVPYPMMHQMSEELPEIYRNNVKFWQPETMPNFDSVLPGMYLAMRMSWNNKLQPKAVLDEFFTRYHGAAAAPMRRYWQTIDDAWTSVPEHAGCGFGLQRRFTPAVMQVARAAMNDALKAAKTPAELQRVQLQDDALKQFELFMKLRWDLADGRLAELAAGDTYYKNQVALGDKYAPQSAFSKVGWTPHTIGGAYFKAFYGNTYEDGARIARDFKIISPSLRTWRHMVDKEKKGEASGWHNADFDDKSWKTTDVAVDTWFSLGLDAYYGPVFYRTTVPIAAAEGKKTYLWVSSEDGDIKLYVNGQHVPYVNEKGETKPFFNGYCNPISFDISKVIKPNQPNQITIIGTRTFINELGTGGLLGPAIVYQEK